MVIGVYGLGRFGGFWAERLAIQFNVIGWSRSADRPTPAGVKRVDEDELLSADVVILCVTISAMDDVLRRIAPRLGANAMVMDTCSVKAYPAGLMVKHLPDTVEIMATHPMFGPDSGRNGLEGLPMVLSPVRVDDAAVVAWKERFASMGLQVMIMTPDEHDKEAAYTQGITHVIGRLLGELELDESPIATTGYRGLREIVSQTCNDPWQLFVDLQKYNPYTEGMRQNLHEALNLMLKKFDSIEVPQEG